MKQMEMSKYKKRRLNKKTVKEIKKEEKIEQEDSETDGSK